MNGDHLRRGPDGVVLRTKANDGQTFEMSGLDWGAIEAAERRRQPYDYAIVPQALTPAAVAAIPGEFPEISQTGSFPLTAAQPGPVLSQVIEDLTSDRFRLAMQRLFDVDLEGRPTLVTLRGQCGPRDGRVHTDSASKILSLLLYLNDGWQGPDGRLRLLGPSRDLSAPAVEVSPTIGTLLAFRRSDRSWHGHTPFVGQRRVLQLNYLVSAKDSMASSLRHRLSALGKRLVA
jgi:hypothetical protein